MNWVAALVTDWPCYLLYKFGISLKCAQKKASWGATVASMVNLM